MVSAPATMSLASVVEIYSLVENKINNLRKMHSRIIQMLILLGSSKTSVKKKLVSRNSSNSSLIKMESLTH